VVAELLGWFGAGLSCVISLPQVVRTMRTKRLDGISSATYLLVLANAAAWTVWSLLTGEYAAGVPALVNGPVAVVILHRLVATRHTARRKVRYRGSQTRPPDSLTSGGNRLPVNRSGYATNHRARRWATVGHARIPSPYAKEGIV
jgi:uncharacterized protein with PQ loop repeat